MAEAKQYDMAVYPTAGLVRSASNGAATHQVTLASCDCADFINRKGRLIEVDGVLAVTICKHNAEFLARIGGWNRQPEQRVTHEDVTRERARTILAEAGLTDSAVRSLLNSIRVHNGKDSFRSGRVDQPDGEVTYDDLSGRYTIVLTY